MSSGVDEPREWDFGAWHHAVMGVGLDTDAGPFAVTWTDTFSAHGVEVADVPMASFFVGDDGGPESWPVTGHPECASRVGRRVTGVETFWERAEFGPARYSDGTVAAPARTVETPVALRLDVGGEAVWPVAGIPQAGGGLCVGGDEIVEVFSSRAMREFGFPAGAFTD